MPLGLRKPVRFGTVLTPNCAHPKPAVAGNIINIPVNLACAVMVPPRNLFPWFAQFPGRTNSSGQDFLFEIVGNRENAAEPSPAAIIYSDLGPGNSFIVNREYETNFDVMTTPFISTGEGFLLCCFPG
jgi:hypothetical protein